MKTNRNRPGPTLSICLLGLASFMMIAGSGRLSLAGDPPASSSWKARRLTKDKTQFGSDRDEPPAASPSSPNPATPPAKSSNSPKQTEPVDGDEVMLIDLPTALRLVQSANPTLNMARERVSEAYARLDQADVLWLPNLRFGPAYGRHDGQLQTSRGDVIGVSKSNFFMGGGAILSVEVSDALYAPLIAQRLAQAESGAARAVSDQVELNVASTYLDLVSVYGHLAINADTLVRAKEMLEHAEIAAKPGIGLSKFTSDVTRARAEVASRKRERSDLEGEMAMVSARLAQLLLLRPSVDLRPAERAVVPITLVPADESLDELIAAGLLNRPELAQSRELMAAAVTRWRQSRVGPLIPRLDLGYFGGDFGGGINDKLGNFSGRSDGLVLLTWEFHNLGAGDLARLRERRSQMNQANFHVLDVQAQVAAEITAFAKVSKKRLSSLTDAQTNVTQALETWRRLKAAAFGMSGKQKLYEALEPLIAEQALAQARGQYLDAIIEYNRSQFRLFAAMGQPPADALPHSKTEPIKVEVLPSPDKEKSPDPPKKP
jgi:outer membrane protein TolC